MSPDDDLRGLAPVEPRPACVSRVRRVACGELAAARGPRWRVMALHWWTPMALPAAITFIIVGYLHWALRAASGLYR